MEKMNEKILQFPKNAEKLFSWKDKKGELMTNPRGLYVIIKDSSGHYEVRYVEPGSEDEIDSIFEIGGGRVVEKREINSGKNFEEFRQKCAELNKTAE